MVYWDEMYKYEVLRHKKATKTILLTLESVKNIVFVAISYIIVMLFCEQLLYFLFGQHLSCGQHLAF